jgi:hypothetical protein
MSVDKFTDGAIECTVYCYENDMIDLYQVEELMDYFSASWTDLIKALTIDSYKEEAIEFMQENNHD